MFDFGCGEGSLLCLLVQPFEEAPITRLAGADICHKTLINTVEECLPRESECEDESLRLTPLTIDLYQGVILGHNLLSILVNQSS